jgi:hypothetical protein
MNIENKDLGTFNIKDEVVISDPCYKDMDSYNITKKVKSGDWKTRAVISDNGDWGKRVADLFVCHKDYDYLDWEKDWRPIGDCGVDSGQLGIFDKEVYQNDAHEEILSLAESDICNDEPFYCRMCHLTLGDDGGSNTFGGAFSRGVNVNSGFGDGCYEASAIYVNDEIVAIWVNFIPDEDDEDDEDDYDDDIEDEDF